jgi:hypothetical protein
MFSDFFFGDFPKFVWCVGEDGRVYEAKTDAVAPGTYHGYPLEEEDDMCDLIRRVWKARCRQVG